MSPSTRWLRQRQAGVLLHPTALPSPADLGPGARAFVDFLAQSGFRVWQVLPVGPVHEDLSPYLAKSSFAGNTALISCADLQARGLIPDSYPVTGDCRERRQLIRHAQESFIQDASTGDREAYEHFCRAHSDWLPDYALFRCLARLHQDLPWYDWPAPERNREPSRLRALRHELKEEIETERFGQYLFFSQWQSLREYAADRGVRLFGDLPIYVAHDSADVWCRPDLFDLDENARPREVAGVPPDGFSAQGQHWGNPLYRWDRLEAEDFRWWIQRLRHQTTLFDLLRLDHFRAFQAYWAIPAKADSAIEGHWRQGPGKALFQAVFRELGTLPLVAEDLGDITPDVESLRRELGCPGMRVLQFAFEGESNNPHRPHNHRPDTVVYTGTHDNDTTLGWWQACSEESRQMTLDYLAEPGLPMPWPLIQVALNSVSSLAILPAQDLLSLGSEARMNTPGTTQGNWLWQLAPGRPEAGLAFSLRHFLAISGRL